MVDQSNNLKAILDTTVRSIGISNRSVTRRTNITRVSSFYSQNKINESQKQSKRCEVAERLLTVFKRYEDDIVQQYFWSQDFAQDFLCLCQYVTQSFEKEKAFFELNGPTHVFGDIHGNLEDLFFFRDKLWPAGMDVTGGKFLFLGDYIDRGMKGLEVLTYLFAAKVCYPKKVFMLRGNHELRYVNGWEAHYKERSFLWQCKNRFGARLGAVVWNATNNVFDHLPLACTIDRTVFCSHGGIPRGRNITSDENIVMEDSSAGYCKKDTRLVDLEKLHLPARVSPQSADPDITDEPLNVDQLEQWERNMAMDLMWGDPCPSNPHHAPNKAQESPLLNERGFGPGQRGGAAIMFGQRALDTFLDNNNISLMIRAHQATSTGISVTKSGRVLTVFSTSSDHAMGDNSTCAYVLVEDQNVIPVNRFIDTNLSKPHSSGIAGNNSNRIGSKNKEDMTGNTKNTKALKTNTTNTKLSLDNDMINLRSKSPSRAA